MTGLHTVRGKGKTKEGKVHLRLWGQNDKQSLFSAWLQNDPQVCTASYYNYFIARNQVGACLAPNHKYQTYCLSVFATPCSNTSEGSPTIAMRNVLRTNSLGCLV